MRNLILSICLVLFAAPAAYAFEENKQHQEAVVIDDSRIIGQSQHSVSVAGYFMVEEEHLLRSRKQIIRTLFVRAQVQGQDFSIPIKIFELPMSPLAKEFTDVHVGDFVWLHVNDKGEVLEMGKKEPIRLR